MAEEFRIDAIGRAVKVGTFGVYSDTMRETSALKQGEVVGFTPKKVRVMVDNWPWRVARGEPDRIEVLKFPEQIARIID